MTETRVSPFPNGTSFMVWTELNCDRCKKQGACRIEEALTIACCTDGMVSAEVGQVIGAGAEGYAGRRCGEWEDNGYVPPPPPPPMARVLRELRHVKEKVEAMFERAQDADTSEPGGASADVIDGAIAITWLDSAIEIAEKALAHSNPLTLTPDEAALIVTAAVTGEVAERGPEFKAILQRLDRATSPAAR